ncbi:hypothetical protein JCM8202v2_002765 [Rhodotorula sphaerocarpa]
MGAGPARDAEHYESVAAAALAAYAALPPRGKPKRRDNRVPEWTVLAAVCLLRQSVQRAAEVRCVSLGTGLKALPHAKLPVHGDVLHDSHAEVIARRGFHLWTYAQIERARKADAEKGKAPETESEEEEASYFERDSSGCWRLRPEWHVAFYVSTLPCGDASTYLLASAASELSADAAAPLMASHDNSGQAPSRSEAPQSSDKLVPSLQVAARLGMSTSRDAPRTDAFSTSFADPSSIVHRGRVSYESMSCLRTKPGRADSPPTTSHSCSDKLATWSLLGLQGALLSQLGVRRIPIEMLVVGGVPPEHRDRVEAEVRRAVGGRLEPWARSLGLSEADFRVPTVYLTDAVFEHSREAVAATEGCDPADIASCAESLSYVTDLSPWENTVEIIVNGIRQGAPSRRKPGEPLGPKARSV